MKNVEEMYAKIQPLIDSDQIQSALNAMEQLLQEHPDFAAGYQDLGSLYLEVGDKEKTEKAYQKAIDLEPDNNAFLRSIADFYYAEMEDVELSLRYYRRIIDNGTNSAELYFITANLLLVSGRLEDAVAHYEKVLDIEPWHMDAFNYLEKVQKHISAIKNGNEELSVEELIEKAADFGLKGEDEAAVAILEKVIEREPGNALAHNDIGVYAYRLGQKEKCLTNYRTATELDSSNVNFQKNLADFLCFVNGEVVEALTIYLRLLQNDPEDVEVLMSAGHINRAMGRSEDSKIFFERVLEIEPWNFEAGESLEAISRPEAIQAEVH